MSILKKSKTKSRKNFYVCDIETAHAVATLYIDFGSRPHKISIIVFHRGT